MHAFRMVGLIGLMVAASACADDRLEPEATAPSVQTEVGQTQILEVDRDLAGLPDSLRRILSGAVVRGMGGVGVPGPNSRLVTGRDGGVLTSEVTRGSDGRIARLRTVRNGGVILDARFEVQGDSMVATYVLSGRQVLSFRVKSAVASDAPSRSASDQTASRALTGIMFAQQGGGGGTGDECTSATLAYYIAVGLLIAAYATIPLDPTPAQMFVIYYAISVVAEAQSFMNYVCSGDPH